MFKNHQEALHAKKTELNAMLSSILKGNVPRMYGEMPKHLGKFERIAPGTKLYDNAVKLRRLGLAGRKAEMKKVVSNALRVQFQAVAPPAVLPEDGGGLLGKNFDLFIIIYYIIYNNNNNNNNNLIIIIVLL